MENPAQDIYKVVQLVDASSSPDVQKAAVNRYFTPDAGFRYPIFAVEPGPLSRESILGIYQWLRIISPKAKGEVNSVVYDKARDVLLLDVSQNLHIRFLPFSSTKSRMLTRLTLRKEGGLHYIAMQEDFMQPDDIASLLFPPLKPIVKLLLMAGTIASNLGAKTAQVLGIWRAPPGIEFVGDENSKAQHKRRDKRRRLEIKGAKESAGLKGPDAHTGRSSSTNSRMNGKPKRDDSTENGNEPLDALDAESERTGGKRRRRQAERGEIDSKGNTDVAEGGPTTQAN